jgi:hypothetical protein
MPSEKNVLGLDVHVFRKFLMNVPDRITQTPEHRYNRGPHLLPLFIAQADLESCEKGLQIVFSDGILQD